MERGWKPAIDAVFAAEHDTEEREVGVETDKLVSVPISGDTEIAAHVKHIIVVEGENIEVDDSEDDDGENDLCAGLTFSNVTQMGLQKARGCMLEVRLLGQWPCLTKRVASFPWLPQVHGDEECEANNIRFLGEILDMY